MKYLIIFILVCSGSVIRAQYTRTIENANELMHQGKFREALLLYEYAHYSSTDSLSKNYSLFLRAECFKQMKEYHKSLDELNHISFNRMPDTLIFKATYLTAFIRYCLHDNEGCLSALNALQNQVSDSLLIQKTILLSCLVNIQLGNLDLAKNYADEICIMNGQPLLPDSLFHSSFKKKNAKTAATLSYILPGAGQMYAKNPGDAFFSLTGNSASFLLVFLHATAGYYFIASTSALWLFSRFYFGGVQHARQLAISYNEEKTALEYENVIKSVLDAAGK